MVIEPARVEPSVASATTPTIAKSAFDADLFFPRLGRGAESNLRISTYISLYLVNRLIL